MHEIVEIPLADLQLDSKNARLGEEQPSQQQIYLALAKQQGRRLLMLAEDIVKEGMDPTTLPAVVATSDSKKRYRVVEGNRRVLALKALETPTIVAPALATAEQKRLNDLSDKYALAPIEDVTCVLFGTEEEARHWIDLRHTGENEGRGLVAWDANEKDRFRARTGLRKPAGQVVDFIDKIRDVTGVSSGTGILTTLQRLLGTPEVRERIGLELVDGGKTVVSHFPREEIAKPLAHIIDDLTTGRIKVKDVYERDDRIAYARSLPRKSLPSKAARLQDPVALDDLAAGRATPAKASPAKKASKRPHDTRRTSLIPREAKLNPTPPRINAIYNELLALNVDQYPNACAVLLRVFLELSIDHEISNATLMTDNVRNNAPLAKRMRTLADHMANTGVISDDLRKAVHKIANTQHVIAASTTTFNQYVHNRFVLPKPSELMTSWDELQPFMEKLWP